MDNPRELLVCARYEFRRGQSIETAYENFCDVVGNDAMAYRDFEFWWYRFKEGNFDLDYDRIKNPSKELGDMPVDIMEDIFENLEWNERAVCRKLSGKIREIIDSMKLSIKGISIESFDNSISLALDYVTVIKYEKTQSGCLIKWDKKSKIINGANFRQMLYADLMTIVRNPKLKLNTFSVGMDERVGNRHAVMSDISTFLSSIGHQLNVKSVLFYAKNQEEVLAILPYLKPSVLEQVHFCRYRSTLHELKINKVVELDQWKKARILNAHVLFLDFKVEHLLHFNQIQAHIDAVSKEDVIRLKETILVSLDFEYCELQVESDNSFKDVIEIFGKENVSIPGSTSFIQVYYQNFDNVVSLARKPFKSGVKAIKN